MRAIIATFVICGAALGWSGVVVINAGNATGGLLIAAGLCCLIIAYGEARN